MSNPIIKVLEKPNEFNNLESDKVMTVNGTIQITTFLTLILVASAAFVWSRFTLGYMDLVNALTYGGAGIGFVLALIITFTRNKVLVPVYAVCEGLALGGISAMFESSYNGIVVQAVAGTFATMFSMLLLYQAKIIKCTDKFRSVIFTATASVAVIYVVDLIGRFFNHPMPIINTSSTLGIGFSLAVIVIAALNLIVDFDFIEKGAQNRLPKDFEWYGAFGLMVTLVWLYLEILKLLSKFANRD